MTSVQWTRADVDALVRGRLLMATDETARAVDAPDWVREMAVDLPTAPGAALDLTHPDSRAVLINTWVEAISHPGEVFECDTKSHILGEWARSHVWIVNLIDHPDIGCILIVARRDEFIDEEPPEAVTSGEWDAAAWAMITLDRSGMVRRAEGLVEHIFACAPEELLGRNLVSLWHPDALADTVTKFSNLSNTPGGTYSGRRTLLRPDGTDLWVEIHALMKHDHEFGEDRIMVILHDITQRRAQEEELARSHEELRHLATDFRLLAEEVPSAVFRCDADGTLTFHNSHWAELLLVDGDDVALPARLQEAVDPVDHCRVEALLEALGGGDERVSIEVLAADGRRTLALTCRAIGDDARATSRILGSAHDVTATVELRRETRVDALTGLLNRKGIEEQLVRELDDTPAGVCVAFIDLDNFKEVNDRHGHEVGDQFLIEIARRLRRAVRPGDAVGRFGGDEFVVVFRDAAGADAAVRARVDAQLTSPLAIGGEAFRPAASIGFAHAHTDDDLHRLLRRADEAMFAVKRARQATEPADRRR